jgi:hypothetical protein
MLDYSIYSYADLKKAYLGRLQEIHPDKKKSSKDMEEWTVENTKKHFHDLQNAWDNYEVMASAMKKVTGGDKEASNFTMFGVGCSFSDNEEERALRDEITDQACRGWFSSGQIAAPISTVNGSSSSKKKINKPTVSLADDDMFEEAMGDSLDTSRKMNGSAKQRQSPPSLIPGLKQRQR